MRSERSTSHYGALLEVRMFSSEYPPCWGGVGRHVQNLCRRLQRRVKLRLATATYGEPNEQFEINNLARLRVKSFPILLAQYLLGLRLQRWTQTEVLHVHVPHAFLPKVGKRIVSTFHVVWADYADALEYQRPASMFDLQFPRVNQRLIRIEKCLADMSVAVIAVSQSVKNQLIARYGIAPEKIRVIHNGVNTSGYYPSTSRRNFILYIGRQTAHKGLPYLLQAFAKFSKSHDEYELIIVGERLEGGVDPSLRRFSKELGIAEKIRFTGRLSERDARIVLGRARCLVLPSLAEAFGMTVLEAMASETPVIATDVGGIPEVLTHELNGLLVPPANANALANSLHRIASDPKLRRMLIEGGIRTSKKFSWDIAAQKTLKVYRDVCG